MTDPLGKSLERLLVDERYREAGVMTFLTGASGIALAGVGASFWALLVGILAVVML